MRTTLSFEFVARRERPPYQTVTLEELVRCTCQESRSGQFLLLRYTMKDRLRAKLKEIREALLRRRHLPVPVQGEWLGA